jgi:hypothetical protein
LFGEVHVFILALRDFRGSRFDLRLQSVNTLPHFKHQGLDPLKQRSGGTMPLL